MEILLYFTSAKDARYEITAGTRSCEPVGGDRNNHVPAEVCKAKAPDNAAWTRVFPADLSSGL